MLRVLAFLIVIIVASSIFRLTNLDLIEFKADEAINLLLAAQPRFNHSLPPGGTVSSIGILNPPLFTYLLLPVTFFTLDPRIFSFIIAITNVLSIGFLFLLFRKYYGLLNAFITTVFLALSPWMIIFSRKIWTQDLLIPFTVPFLYSVHKIVLEKKMEYWTLFTVSSLFLIQLHQTSIVFLLLVGVFLIFRKTKVHVLYATLGIIIGFLPLIPYIAYQLQNGCPDCQAFIAARERLITYSPSIFLRPLQILGQGDFHHILGGDMLTFKNAYPLLYKLRAIFYLEYLLLPIGVLLFIKRNLKMRFLAYSTLPLPFIYFFLKTDPFAHYFLIVAPLLFLFIGHAFSYSASAKNKLFSACLIVVLILLLIISFSFNVAFYSLLDKRKGFGGDYGMSFSASEKIVSKQIQKYKDDKRYQEMFIASYIPKSLMHGNLPVPRMIYNFDKTKKNLTTLEQRLINAPEDPLTQNEVLAFYTRTTPTRETLRIIKQKIKTISAYDMIYKEAKNDYQTKNLKKIYEDEKISLEYPQHWSLDITKNGIRIQNDKYILFMFRFPQPETKKQKEKAYIVTTAKILGQDVEKSECTSHEDKWCGIIYKDVNVGNMPYTFILSPRTSSLENLSGEIKVMHNIISSISPL